MKLKFDKTNEDAIIITQVEPRQVGGLVKRKEKDGTEKWDFVKGRGLKENESRVVATFSKKGEAWQYAQFYFNRGNETAETPDESDANAPDTATTSEKSTPDTKTPKTDK